ncbi:ABC transporter ATP-binding protein [Cohnella fermenti]|uniref:ABC transporter ATP-binding protein n=2 Tax=Cohnella fermenti TaxID=2565925 RepID=A0A4S4BR28_9BACL|nr:ABC transporter ATP-binding protein [Cohnella fermenti]
MSLFGMLRPYRLAMIIAVALMLFEVLVEVWHPILLGRIIDDGVIGGDRAAIAKWGGAMIGVSLLGFVCGIANTFFAAYASHGFSADLRERLFHKTQFASLFHVRRFSNSAWSTRLSNDVNQVQTSVFFGLRMFLRAPLVVAISLALAFTVDAKLSVWMMGATPLVLLGLYVSIRRGFVLFGSAQRELERTNGVVRDNLIGMPLIRAFARDDSETERFAQVNESLRKRMGSALRLSEMTIPSALLFMNLMIVAIVASAGGRIQSGDLGIGAALAMVQYGVRISGSFTYISLIITNVSRARASWSRIRALLAVEPSEAESLGKAEGRRPFEGPEDSGRPLDIFFDKVSFRYPDAEEPALAELSFRIEAGQTVAIMGATGAGKTAFMQLLPRVHEPSAGTIVVGGRPLGAWPLAQLRARIAYVPQQSVLFSGTIRDNLQWGKADATTDELVAAAAAAQIHQPIMRMPQQYETMLEAGGRNLSGGQRQRLAIARALVRNSGLLLLDDSTSALDAETERELLRELRARKATTLLITQKVSAARATDRILLLEGGRLAAQGTHEELYRTSELYRRIVASQNREEATLNA